MTVIDPATRRVLPDHSVYVSGKAIVAVLPARNRRQFKGKSVIDGTSHYLIPGLMDMHFHLFLPEPAPPSLNLLLANGVTGIREMSSDCWSIAGAVEGCVDDYRQLQSKIKAGDIAGPELLALTSTMVMGPTRLTLPPTAPSYVTPATEAEARTLLRYLATRGTDLIKTHDSIPTAAFRALMEEANLRGMKVGGHIPFAAGSLGATQMGYRSIEHARDLLYDCSRYGSEFRRREAAFADRVADAQRPPALERLRRTVAEFDPSLCQNLLKAVAATGAYYDPTHGTREMEARADEPAYRNDPTRKYILAERNDRWEADLNETAALPTEQRQALRGFFLHGLRITGLTHRAGIPIMAGTDASDTMIVPGFSLHNELRLLRAAGLSNMEVLRSATAVPAAYLNRSNELGGISAGKEADLVLLRHDPLRDIHNTSSIQTVIANGIVYSRTDLDVLLKEVERLAAASRRRESVRP
ncbi:MAG TPA: amidohydrolase family protein [Allosphingosinicella sp.]